MLLSKKLESRSKNTSVEFKKACGEFKQVSGVELEKASGECRV